MSDSTKSPEETVARYERALLAEILSVGKRYADESENVRSAAQEVKRCERQLKHAQEALMTAESRRDCVEQIALNDVRAFQSGVDAMRADIETGTKGANDGGELT